MVMDSHEEESEGFSQYACGYCGETNDILIEESIGKSYEVIEDCFVCCRSNIIHIVKEDGRWDCWAAPENE